jgi:hypothetical protein
MRDMFYPTEAIDGKTLCQEISDATNRTLNNVSYVMKDSPNPHFIGAECLDIYTKMKLLKIISDDAHNIINFELLSLTDAKEIRETAKTGRIHPNKQIHAINLLDNQSYTNYCKEIEKKFGRIDDTTKKTTCEKSLTWMNTNTKMYPEERSFCKFTTVPGLILGEYKYCEVDEIRRDEIKRFIQDKINNCIASAGCTTDALGVHPTQKKYMRIDNQYNLGKNTDKIAPTQICCRRSAKAFFKEKMRMDRLYKIIGNMSYDQQLSHIEKSRLSQEEKEIFMQGILDCHKIGEQLVSNFQIDKSTEQMMLSFSVMVRNSFKQEFENYLNLQELHVKKHVESTSPEAIPVPFESERGSTITSILSAIAGVAMKTIGTIFTTFKNLIMYLLKKGFNLLTWLFHHPTTAMWISYGALKFKQKCCEIVSLKIYGSPEIIDVGFFGKAEELYDDSGAMIAELSTFIRKSFLSITYNFIESAGFTTFIQSFITVIESGILYTLYCIPGGQPFALAIQTSGGLKLLLTSASSIISESLHYGFTAMILVDSAQDVIKILTETCIVPPKKQKKQLSLKGIVAEASSATTMISSATNSVVGSTLLTFNSVAESGSGFLNTIAGMTGNLFSS